MLLIAFLVVLTGVLALVAGLRARLTRSREGKILAFVALLILPVVSVWVGFSAQMERATSTSFCLSCHVMNDHGRSLRVDDPSYLAAAALSKQPGAARPCLLYLPYRLRHVRNDHGKAAGSSACGGPVFRAYPSTRS